MDNWWWSPPNPRHVENLLKRHVFFINPLECTEYPTNNKDEGDDHDINQSMILGLGGGRWRQRKTCAEKRAQKQSSSSEGKEKKKKHFKATAFSTSYLHLSLQTIHVK